MNEKMEHNVRKKVDLSELFIGGQIPNTPMDEIVVRKKDNKIYTVCEAFYEKSENGIGYFLNEYSIEGEELVGEKSKVISRGNVIRYIEHAGGRMW